MAAMSHGFIFKKVYTRIKMRKSSNVARAALVRYMLTIAYHLLKNEKPFVKELVLGHPHGELA